jgi:hypothetical protein
MTVGSSGCLRAVNDGAAEAIELGLQNFVNSPTDAAGGRSHH